MLLKHFGKRGILMIALGPLRKQGIPLVLSAVLAEASGYLSTPRTDNFR
jgi:hypothetical protein